MGSTRERLLEVALDLFAEEGFRGTTITEVERRAGLTPGTGSFYRHFASKEELLRAAVDCEVARCMAGVEADHAGTHDADDPVQRLELMLRDIRRFDRLLRLALTDGDRVPEVGEAISKALLGTGEKVTWRDDASVVVRIAALGGYHLLSRLQGPLLGVPEDEFLAAVARMGDA